jgi:hypothetical protein
MFFLANEPGIFRQTINLDVNELPCGAKTFSSSDGVKCGPGFRTDGTLMHLLS